MLTLILYTTSGCHLCDQALALLTPIIELNQLQLRLVDIADSDAMIERYGVRIPVIQLEGTQGELGWPFDEPQALAFLNHSLQELEDA
ncbi:glutaredoxin family protein [Aestuariirhabdus litorea]|uniref:Glutaredoxin family protein n=1 Tax=Aestuariirhabdus litorea TaxID=2528527 RepID=A0A3P3VQA9_9GAMM|nr:glutaredoxin family protein [Aestuariirhabdus litorea]RRJ84634.1 glutaredoxin family protein [Aestuariirhabdus litorea]RWW97859.1 glutaredoxin family protein [Endozoicomonadaceae bacterium GTF-13]